LRLVNILILCSERIEYFLSSNGLLRFAETSVPGLSVRFLMNRERNQHDSCVVRVAYLWRSTNHYKVFTTIWSQDYRRQAYFVVLFPADGPFFK